jgi:hypothetical protein
LDRALNPNRLRVALGGAEGLPTPEALVELLADAEVRLFQGPHRIDPRLVDTAWYLHSVGSALGSLDLYGPERQRAAFQLAGHIFDLALVDPALEPTDRLRLTFAAQVANIRGELNPNAIAAYRWRLGTRGDDSSFFSPGVALEIGAAVLAYDTAWLFPSLRHFRTEIGGARQAWGFDLAETAFGAVALLVEGAWDLLRYLVYGDPATLQTARATLERAVTSEPSSDDLESRWVAFHLWQLGADLQNGSLWAVLPPDTSPSVPRAFTLAHPRILTLWPPQVRLLDRNRQPYALDPSVRRLVLSLPTSAGKTLVAQVLVAEHLSRSPTGACFVAPTRSLCREIEQSLRRRMRFLTVPSEVTSSDSLFDLTQADRATVEVMTPERLAFLLRADPDGVLARFGLFVIDEVHSVGDPGRGWTLEWALSSLHNMTRETNHRIVVMSAAIGNRANIASWLDPGQTGFHYSSDWRGPRRVHSIFTTEPDWSTEHELPRPNVNSPERLEYALHGVLHIRPTATGRVHQLRTTQPVGSLVLRRATRARDAKSTPFYKTLAPLAEVLGRSGPVLVICPTKTEAARLASEIADRREEQSGPRWLVELASARLGAEHPLVRCLRRGVAFHHASLPSEVLAGIEDEVTSGTIHHVVATTTLTEGVNLPVRTVVIAAQGAWATDGDFHEFITGARLLNAIGRAGRATKESEGWIVLARNAQFDRDDFTRLTPSEADLPVQSALTSAQALAQLAELEQQLAADADIALARPGRAIEDFLSFVWYVCSLSDEVDGTPLRGVESFLEATLAWQQLSAADRIRYRRIARAARRRYGVAPPEARRRWSRAGTSLGSAAVLDDMAAAIADQCIANPDALDSVTASLGLVLGNGRLGLLLDLPEAGISWPRNQRGGQGTRAIAFDGVQLLLDWVGGCDVRELADAYLADAHDPEFRLEQLADYLTSAFDNFLPWAFGILIAWVNDALAERTEGEAISLSRSLPAYVRYGVNSEPAVALFRAGLRSRSVAIAVAGDYILHRGSPGESLRDWLCMMDLADWRRRFAPSPSELRALLEFARPAQTRIAATLLSGEVAAIPVRATETVPGDEEATLRPIPGDPEPRRVGIWTGDVLVGYVPAEQHAEVDAVLATGLPLSVRLEAVDGGFAAFLQLVDLDDVSSPAP